MSVDSSNPFARALQPSEQQGLDEARHLLDDGKPGQAAPLFARAAEVLTSVSRQPQRAANLHAQAALAFAQSHDEAPALMQARAALNLFVQFRMFERASVFHADITRELTQRGMKDAADTLTNEFASRIVSPPTHASPHAAAHLPTSCPQCGAPIRSNEVHWIDDNTAECNYCSASIRSAG